MDEMERLLVLEAALTLVEGLVSSELTGDLYEHVSTKINAAFPVFDDFLRAQGSAVAKLPGNSVLFGC